MPLAKNGRYLYPHPVTGEPVSRQRIYQLRRQAEGRCQRCGKALTLYAIECAKCHAWSVRYKRKARGCKPWRRNGPGRVPITKEEAL